VVSLRSIILNKLPPAASLVEFNPTTHACLRADTHRQKNLRNLWIKIDKLVKSQKTYFFVIPVKAGIQYFQIVVTSMDSGFHRSDDFLRVHQN